MRTDPGVPLAMRVAKNRRLKRKARLARQLARWEKRMEPLLQALFRRKLLQLLRQRYADVQR